MKITFLTRSLGLGGAERQLVALAIGLRRRGHDVRVVVFYSGGPLTDDLVAGGVSVASVDKRWRWDIAGFGWRLITRLRAARPDVLYTFLTMPNVVGALVRPVSGARLVWGVRATQLDFGRYDRLVAWSERIQRWLARAADLIVCNAERGRDDVIASGFPADRTVVIPNGIDTSRFRPDLDARRRLRAELGVDDSTPLIGLVGRLDPMKGHETFIRAAHKLIETRPDVRFIGFGDGPRARRAELGALASQLGIGDQVRLEPAHLDAPAVFNALDLLCSASSYGEGFPNVIGEAMACGVPCVVTDVGDSRLIVGALGRVVPAEDTLALAEALSLSLAVHATPSEVRARIVDVFSLEQAIVATERALATTSPHSAAP